MAKSNGKTKLKADRKKEDDSTSRRKALDIKESKRKTDKNKKKYHDVVASDVGFPLGPTDRIGVLRCVEGQLEAAPSVWMDNLSDKFCNGGGLAMTSDYSGIGQPAMPPKNKASHETGTRQEVKHRMMWEDEFYELIEFAGSAPGGKLTPHEEQKQEPPYGPTVVPMLVLLQE